MTLRPPNELYRRLAAIAEATGSNVSAVVNQVLLDALPAWERRLEERRVREGESVVTRLLVAILQGEVSPGVALRTLAGELLADRPGVKLTADEAALAAFELFRSLVEAKSDDEAKG